MLAPLLIALSLALIGQSPQSRPEREVVTVRLVINSNTVAVATADDPMLWVTLLGVGTPETVDPEKPDFLVGKADPGWLASWLAPGRKALMERRGTSVTGRPLVLLYRAGDGLCWNAYLVKVGAAFAARQIEFPEYGKLASLGSDAQRQGLGIWRGYVAAEPARAAREAVAVAMPGEQSGGYASVQRFNPANFPPHAKKRYASQEAARYQLDSMMGAMMTPTLYPGGGYYRGPRQPPGHYAGGVGSSHKGGTYMNSYTGNRYQQGN